MPFGSYSAAELAQAGRQAVHCSDQMTYAIIVDASTPNNLTAYSRTSSDSSLENSARITLVY